MDFIKRHKVSALVTAFSLALVGGGGVWAVNGLNETGPAAAACRSQQARGEACTAEQVEALRANTEYSRGFGHIAGFVLFTGSAGAVICASAAAKRFRKK